MGGKCSSMLTPLYRDSMVQAFKEALAGFGTEKVEALWRNTLNDWMAAISLHDI